MFKFIRLQNTVAGGAIIIALFSIFSRLLGLLRDRFLSSSFGAGQVLDAYYAAFRLPDLVFNTLVLGAFSSAFIPVFLQYFSQDKKQAWQITSSVLNILFLIVLFLAVLFFILAPLIINLMVPGFTQEVRILTVSLTRIMLISILFFTLSNVAGSVLNSFRRFLIYSIAPIMYNLGIIFGILFLTKTSLGLMGLAWGVVLGSVLHFLVQVPALLQTGYAWKPVFNLFHPALKKIVKLMLPRCFGLAINQFNFIVVTFIASVITIGAVAIYNLAFNLVSFPVGIFGVSLAISIFPLLSQNFIDGERSAFSRQFSKTIRQILYLIVPTTVLFIALRAQIVRLILGAGVFSWRDTVLTAQTLGWFSISLFTQSLIPIFARAFYATQDTKTPVKIALVSFLINIIGCAVLGPLIGITGLAVAFSLSSLVNFILLYLVFHKKVIDLQNREIGWSVLKIIGLCLLMAIVVQAIKYQAAALVDMQTFIGVFIQTASAIIGGGLFYFLMSLVFKFSEIEMVYQMIARRLRIFKDLLK